jgi:hypothetical protein
MAIPRKNGQRYHGGRSEKIPEQERDKEEETVEELTMVGPCKAFKLGFPFEQLQLMENPDFWPQGAVVQPFRFSHRTWRHHRGATIDMDG